MASTVVTLTSAASEELAAEETAHQLDTQCRGAAIRGGILFTTIHYDTVRLQSALRLKIPGIPFIGTTSCLGVGAAPARYARGRTLVGLWLVGDGFRFGVACGEKENGRAPTAVGESLAAEALARGGFQAHEARFAVVHPTPGFEEALLTGIYQVLTKKTPIIGGSAADDDISGNWCAFTHERVTRNGVVLALCDWPWRLAVNYQAAYLPTGKRGKVTRAEGRRLYEIDDRPATEVYNEWLGGRLTPFLKRGGNVLAETTLNPFGIPYNVGMTETFVLVHPERVLAQEKALSLFADVETGQDVALMTSWPEALVQRGASVARSALVHSELSPKQIVGGLMVYCAGNMLAIRDRMPEMLAEFQAVVGNIPYASVFTFGEQGCVLPGHVDHGNLMASVLLLTAS